MRYVKYFHCVTGADIVLWSSLKVITSESAKVALLESSSKEF
jgi:hypothetical protein